MLRICIAYLHMQRRLEAPLALGVTHFSNVLIFKVQVKACVKNSETFTAAIHPPWSKP